jgi:hypothetical protein
MAIDRLKARVRHLSPTVVVFAALFLGLAIVVGILAPWKTAEFIGSCVPANRVDQVGQRIYDNHKAVTVRRGSIVTVQLWTGAGDLDWPWQEPVSSNSAVMASIPLCANPPNITTVPLTLTPFKAVAPGTATITASVKPQDTSSFQTFVLTVTVVP